MSIHGSTQQLYESIIIQQKVIDPEDQRSPYCLTWSPSTTLQDNFYKHYRKHLPKEDTSLKSLEGRWNAVRRGGEENYEKYYDRKILLNVGNGESIVIPEEDYEKETALSLWKRVKEKNPDTTTLSLIVQESKKKVTLTIVDKNNNGVADETTQKYLDEKMCNIHDEWLKKHKIKNQHNPIKQLYAESKEALDKKDASCAEYETTLEEINKDLSNPSTIFLAFPLQNKSEEPPTINTDNSSSIPLIILLCLVVAMDITAIIKMQENKSQKASKTEGN